jgi:GTP-binding protein
MLNLSKCQFVKSAPGKKDFLLDRKQVVFLGRSNVGKSSLINALTGIKKMAFVSKTPGRTQMLSYFDIDKKFYLVDAPGYGYYDYKDLDFEPLMLSYLEVGSRIVRRAYVLIDVRRGVSEDDKAVLKLLTDHGIPYRIVFTKCEKMNQSEKAVLAKEINSFFPGMKVIVTSAEKNIGIDELKRDVSESLL